MKNMRLVPLAIDSLDLCELLPCIGSGTVFRYPGRIMDVGTWYLRFYTKNAISAFLDR